MMKYDLVMSFLSAPIGLIKDLKDLILILVLVLLLNGCYTSKSISLRSQESLDKINRNVSKRTSQIKVIRGESFTGKGVRVKMDSTFWWDAKAETTRHIVATSEIESISIKKRNTLKGLGYGFLLGAVLGGSIIQTGLLTIPCHDCNRFEGAVLGAILFSPPSMLIGLISGVATKTTESYEFKQ